MNHILEDSPLGQNTGYVCKYDPGQLFAIPRTNSWQHRGYAHAPFYGCDIWNAYELSWLNSKGLPQAATAECRVSCTSPFLIESKSFKLYLNSFNLSRFKSVNEVRQHMLEDLSKVAGAEVAVEIQSLNAHASMGELEGECIDQLDVEIEHYQPAPQLLHIDREQNSEGETVKRQLYSHLLKSNCPVTGQPDWASIQIEYRGLPINKEGLLKYLVSYREHGDFHEQCVEQIFLDILERCKPERLSVYARYLRRGGLDINPFRSTEKSSPDNRRLVRQ